MDNDEIRFRALFFDWFKRTVSIKYSVGTRDNGGYEDEKEMSFELFSQVIDTTKLQNILNPKQQSKPKAQ